MEAPANRALPDARWAVIAGIAGLVGLACYVALITMDGPIWIGATLAFGFAGGFALTAIGIALGVTREVAPRLGLLAAAANALAAALLLAMALVQMAVKQVNPHPGHEMTAIWLGLDVAWDMFGATGSVLLALALWWHPRFPRLLAVSGVLISALLLVLNTATFPTPPAEAGLFDAGPFVGLWYVVLSVYVLVAVRHEAAVSPA